LQVQLEAYLLGQYWLLSRRGLLTALVDDLKFEVEGQFSVVAANDLEGSPFT
jgi:hypothetical protein